MHQLFSSAFITKYEFDENCLIKDNTLICKKVINLYISHTLKNSKANFALGNCLFGSVKLIKNANLDKHKYNGHDVGLGSRSKFLFTDGSYGNLFIFGADMTHLCMLIITEKIP